MVSTLIGNQKKKFKKKNNANAAKCRTKRRDEVIKARWEERADFGNGNHRYQHFGSISFSISYILLIYMHYTVLFQIFFFFFLYFTYCCNTFHWAALITGNAASEENLTF